MKRFSLFFLFSVLTTFPTLAQEAEDFTYDDVSTWKANFRRVALEMSSTQVSNAEQYQDSPSSKLSADSQTVFKGVFDFSLENEQPNAQWNNSLFMEYGKTKLKETDGTQTTNENADKILLTTDYARKVWRYEDADVGPFVNLGYQTEFTKNNDSPRTQIIRGKGGLKLFNGIYIKELYAAIVEELDLTYSQSDTKTAYEIGIRSEYPLRDGVKFQLDGYFRDYVIYSRYIGTDFKYELDVTGRLDVKLTDTFSLAPYINYYQAQDRQTPVKGSNFVIGIALSFSNLFNLN